MNLLKIPQPKCENKGRIETVKKLRSKSCREIFDLIFSFVLKFDNKTFSCKLICKSL